MLYFKLQFVCAVWLTTTWYSTQWRYYISPSSSNRKTKVVCSIHPQVYFPSFVCVCVCVCLLCSNIVLYTPDTSTACLYVFRRSPHSGAVSIFLSLALSHYLLIVSNISHRPRLALIRFHYLVCSLVNHFIAVTSRETWSHRCELNCAIISGELIYIVL